jgi:dATP pyrophosphohydrolase
MSRAPFQVLVLPFIRQNEGEILYAVFSRADDELGYWQFVAGGGEGNETPLAAAKREAKEEASIDPDSLYLQLDSCTTIPVVDVCGFLWGSGVLVIPEYAFAVEMRDQAITISEHCAFRWVTYCEARELLHWDSNRNALWELNHRLTPA